MEGLQLEWRLGLEEGWRSPPLRGKLRAWLLSWTLEGCRKARGAPEPPCRAGGLFSTRQSPFEGLNLIAPDTGAPHEAHLLSLSVFCGSSSQRLCSSLVFFSPSSPSGVPLPLSPIQRCYCGSPQLTASWGCWARTQCPCTTGTCPPRLPQQTGLYRVSAVTQPGSCVQRSRRCHSNREAGARPARLSAAWSKTLNDSGCVQEKKKTERVAADP